MIRTATTARSGRVAALAAVLTGLVLTLTGCGGQSGPQVWIGVDDGYNRILGLTGDRVVWISPAGHENQCSSAQQAISDIKADSVNMLGKRNDGTYEVEGSGQLAQDRTTVLWDDERPGSIAIGPDVITMDYVFGAGADNVTLVPVDSERGKAGFADFCD